MPWMITSLKTINLYTLAEPGADIGIYTAVLCGVVEEEYLPGHDRALHREPGRRRDDAGLGSEYVNQPG